MAVGAISFWNEWAIQFSVLASLTLQILLLLAKIRRTDSSWRLFRFILWLAYQLADVTATSALSLCLGAAPREHLLVAFWAQFLLLHLGGPDSITAYALEDNKLWPRHGLNLFVQVPIAIYVVYKHYIGTGDLLRPATILMCLVGSLKYVERTYALKRSNMDNIRSSLKKELRARYHFYLEDKPPKEGFKEKVDEEEFLMRHALSLFHICKHAIVDSSVYRDEDNSEIKVLKDLTNEHRYAVMELELSLMYDILYTKAALVHTLFGYCIRIISPATTAAALLLFQFSDKDGHNRVDVAITYVLLGYALLLEIISLLSALGSSWTLPFLCDTQWSWLQHAVMCAGRWDRLRRWVVCVHWLIKVMRLTKLLRSTRRWSGTVGQYNMLYYCCRPSKRNSPLVGRFANMLGVGELWEREHYSWSVKFPDHLKHKLMQYVDELVEKGEVSTQGIVRKKWGKVPLRDSNLYKDLHTSLGVEFQEGIIVWHIATDLFLDMSRKEAKFKPMEDKSLNEEAIRLLSNYMMFLLVKRPYMLPGLGQSKLYGRTCENLVDLWCKEGEERLSLSDLLCLYDDPNSHSSLGERKKLANMVMKHRSEPGAKVPRLEYAAYVARVLVRNDEDENHKLDSLQVLLNVWMDFLIHAANRCSRESHAKKLSSGGEFTTIIWLLNEHMHQPIELEDDPNPQP